MYVIMTGERDRLMATPAPLIGQSCGKYQITSLIGEGGMGAVYLARHELIENQAVIKVLLPQFSHNKELVKRFFNEAKAAAAVKHPSIIAIHDFGYRPDGTAYIVMEYLDGQPLSARMRHGHRFDQARALDIAWQIADGLRAVHECGIVHRDLKPDNLFLVPDPAAVDGERVKILDFGIAKLTETQDGVKTRTGAVMGTPIYMSPEQCRGAGEVDHRADLYSLGCILFQMLCGRPPFRGAGAGDVIAAHLMTPPPAPRSLVPEVSRTLEASVLRLLEKDPAARYQSARETMDALASLGTNRVTSPGRRAVTSGPRHPMASDPMASDPDAPTLAAAAVASTIEPTGKSERSRSRLAIPLVLAVSVAVAVALFAMRPSGQRAASDVESAQTPTTTPAPTATPTATTTPPEAQPEPVGDPPGDAAGTVQIRLQSRPADASVLLEADGEQVRVGAIGAQALVLSYPVSPDMRVFVIRKDGYLDQRVSVPGDTDVERVVELRPEPADTGPSKPARKASKPTRAGKKETTTRPQNSTTSPTPKDPDEQVDTSHKNPFDL